jgi:hypothetical protein
MSIKSSVARPYKNYPNLDIWFETMPFGNPPESCKPDFMHHKIRNSKKKSDIEINSGTGLWYLRAITSGMYVHQTCHWITEGMHLHKTYGFLNDVLSYVPVEFSSDNYVLSGNSKNLI